MYAREAPRVRLAGDQCIPSGPAWPALQGRQFKQSNLKSIVSIITHGPTHTVTVGQCHTHT